MNQTIIVEYPIDSNGCAVVGPDPGTKRYGPFHSQEAAEQVLREIGAENTKYLSVVDYANDRPGDWEIDTLWGVPAGESVSRAFEITELEQPKLLNPSEIS